jgi:hypothetical protein
MGVSTSSLGFGRTAKSSSLHRLGGQEILKRSRIYAILRDTLFAYSESLHSVDVEIFAVEMELDTMTGESADPALLSEFNKAFPDDLSVGAALMLAADYVDREIVGLRHIELARSIVRDFRLAACAPEMRNGNLKGWKSS